MNCVHTHSIQHSINLICVGYFHKYLPNTFPFKISHANRFCLCRSVCYYIALRTCYSRVCEWVSQCRGFVQYVCQPHKLFFIYTLIQFALHIFTHNELVCKTFVERNIKLYIKVISLKRTRLCSEDVCMYGVRYQLTWTIKSCVCVCLHQIKNQHQID